MAEVYSRAGRQMEARAQAAEVLRINPQFSLEEYAKNVRRIDKQEWIDVMRRTGLK
jgi:hypothetical protein